MKVPLVTILALFLANYAFPQQIASVDLTQHRESPQSTEEPKVTPVPEACGITADGVVVPEDNQPRKIWLELTKVSDLNPKAGSEVVAEIQLRNIDARAIKIPWSTDPGVIKNGQDPDHLEWEQGGFEILLKDRQSKGFVLKSPELPLYGSKFSPGSLLTIQPGESVIAKMNFKIEDRYFGTPEGESWLSVEWKQAARTWTRSKCGVSTGWFDYDRGFYHQEGSAMTIQVTGSESSRNGKANN